MGGRLSGLHMRPQEERDWVGTLRDLKPIITEIGEAADQVFDFSKGGQDVLQKLADAYQLPGGPGDGDGNATDLVGERIPRADSERTQPRVGGGFKNTGLKLRLIDLKILPSPSTLTLSGEAKATLELATDYPAAFDTPSEINLRVTSTSISASQIGVTGSATMDKVLHADLTLQLHYDPRQLFEAVVRFAKKRNLTRSEVEQLLRSVSLDAKAIMKLGFVPISIMKLSASSVLPMRRPLIGATDELLPAQLSSLPNREVFRRCRRGSSLTSPSPRLHCTTPNMAIPRGSRAPSRGWPNPTWTTSDRSRHSASSMHAMQNGCRTPWISISASPTPIRRPARKLRAKPCRCSTCTRAASPGLGRAATTRSRAPIGRGIT
jgi:hypothetical protein